MLKKILLPLLSGLILFSCSNGDKADEVSSSTWEQGDNLVPVAVEVLEVSKGLLVPTVEASGIIRGKSEAWVLSGTQGKITSLSAELGMPVRKDDILLTVENDLQKLNRDLTKQQYDSALLDFNALKNSFSKGGISRSDYNAAQNRLLQSRTTYETALKNYEATFLRAPFSGSIALMDTGLAVGAQLSPGARVALVVDTSSMKMNISLGESQVDLIQKGQAAEVQITSLRNLPPVEARVEAIGSGSDENTGSFPVLITWKNDSGESVRSGLSARVIMKNTREKPQIIIPSSAIIIRDRKTSAMVAENGKSAVREIVAGESMGGYTIVKSGLKEGDLLIVSALSSLGDQYAVETTIGGKTGERQ